MIFLLALTALRLLFAAFGHLNEIEAYLLLCSHHLDWSFVEGPAGVPALIRLSTSFFGITPLSIRFFGPLLLCVASWIMTSLARALHGEKVAWWSLVAFNLLPLTNAAALVMEGTMVIAAWWILASVAAWKIMIEEKKSLASWWMFGILLGVGTQFSYSIGLLLFVVFLWEWIVNRNLIFHSGLGASLVFLVLGWLGPFSWNLRHDWLSWKKVTWSLFWSWQMPSLENASPFFWSILFLLPLLLMGITQELFLWWQSSKKKEHKEGALLILLILPFFFYFHELGQRQAGFSWLLVIAALFLPGVVAFFLKKVWLRKSGIGLLALSAFFSLLLVFGKFSSSSDTASCWSIPNIQGVTGLQPVAVTLLRWRVAQQDATGKLPFIIAQSPGLAALLGSVLPITYPELPEAPSVFVPESPGLENQFQLWSNYAEATAAATLDPLYTEEKVTSPFLGRNALYVTSETSEELPQTIHGAFSVLEPLEVVALSDQGKIRKLFIYHCKNYQMLAL